MMVAASVACMLNVCFVSHRPKCGIYTEMPPDEQVPASQNPEPLPHLTMKDPDAIIKQRLAEIRAQRVMHRAVRVPLDKHFTPEELEALQVAFARADVADKGYIFMSEIGTAFNQAGRTLIPILPTS